MDFPIGACILSDFLDFLNYSRASVNMTLVCHSLGLFEGRLGLLGVVWDLLVVIIELGTSGLVYILLTRVLGSHMTI